MMNSLGKIFLIPKYSCNTSYTFVNTVSMFARVGANGLNSRKPREGEKVVRWKFQSQLNLCCTTVKFKVNMRLP